MLYHVYERKILNIILPNISLSQIVNIWQIVDKLNLSLIIIFIIYVCSSYEFLRLDKTYKHVIYYFVFLLASVLMGIYQGIYFSNSVFWLIYCVILGIFSSYLPQLLVFFNRKTNQVFQNAIIIIIYSIILIVEYLRLVCN